MFVLCSPQKERQTYVPGSDPETLTVGKLRQGRTFQTPGPWIHPQAKCLPGYTHRQSVSLDTPTGKVSPWIHPWVLCPPWIRPWVLYLTGYATGQCIIPWTGVFFHPALPGTRRSPPPCFLEPRIRCCVFTESNPAPQGGERRRGLTAGVKPVALRPSASLVKIDGVHSGRVPFTCACSWPVAKWRHFTPWVGWDKVGEVSHCGELGQPQRSNGTHAVLCLTLALK